MRGANYVGHFTNGETEQVYLTSVVPQNHISEWQNQVLPTFSLFSCYLISSSSKRPSENWEEMVLIK